MPVTDVTRDVESQTMVVTAEFAAPVDRVWQLWADPRQLERWWGPPGYPATVVDHDLVPGGTVRYVMTGPDGQKYGGLWRVLTVTPPHSLTVEDGFADDSGSPDPSLPVTTMTVALSERAGGTQMVATSRWATREAMEQLLAMGMEEGLRGSMGQIDDLLAG